MLLDNQDDFVFNSAHKLTIGAVRLRMVSKWTMTSLMSLERYQLRLQQL